jgi:predicted Zn-dependent protease
VIAHETAHVTQHHIARQIADSQGNTWKALAGVLGGLVLAAATGNPNVAMAATMGTQAALLQHQINFTRHEEAEADRIGISFMSGAGYDPKGMAQMFEKMEMMSRGELKPPAFLVDHPLNSQRITDARERARDMPASEHSSSRSYLLMRARARVLTSEHVDQALTWFKGVDRKKKTAAERDAIDYGRALCLIRLNRSKKALAILKPLLTKHSDVIALHLAVAEAELQRDRYQSAIAELEHTRHVFPDSLAVKVDYAEALLADNRAADAKSVMEDALSDSPGNSQVLQLLAKSATRAGDKSEGRYYQSQYYELNGELIPAINQIQLALNNPHISDYEHARYEARLDDLKKAHKEHAKKQHDQLRNQVHFSVDRAAVPPWEQPARRHHFRLRN